MRILVANLGSTSFKYRLIEVDGGEELARGAIDRIGQPVSSCVLQVGGRSDRREQHVADHAAAMEICFRQLTDPQFGVLQSIGEVAAVGFKAVFAGPVSGVRRVDEALLETMERFAVVAPAHNPPYVAAMRQLRRAFPDLPLVAAFETAFHRTVPPYRRVYAVPPQWRDAWGIQRYGFHGASHRYIAERSAALIGREDARVISCHLGGSSSVCAIAGGRSVATSMGLSPQSGLPQNNRIGDFDPYALPLLVERLGKPLEEVLAVLARECGLKGLSGVGSDLRDIERAADEGNAQAQLALDAYVDAIRHYLGAYMVALGGLDALVFTGGIGENSPRVRAGVCAGMEWAGIVLDERANAEATGERRISPDGGVSVWVIPTNEELIVARQAAALIRSGQDADVDP
ncbi:MAG: acetate/propionate family kinase [Planctomycetota bacterium]|nr:MAG: acetate/propionate family kinase [Planctomycetota bacterium]